MEMIKLIIAGIFIFSGLFFLIVTMCGVFKYKYVLNKMQAAAMGDTLGIAFCLIGLMILCGFTLTTVKFLLVIVFLWIASPVASHLISRLEVTTKEDDTKEWEEQSDDNI